MPTHTPVLLQEVLEGLKIHKGDTVVDATLGGSGYAQAFCRAVGAKGTVIGFDADAGAVANAQEVLKDVACSVEFVVGNFRDMEKLLRERNISHVHAVAFDLGFSSMQLEASGRGFSFQHNEPLLMTFKHTPGPTDLTAAQIVNNWSEESIANVLYGYGGERAARKLASAIVTARKEKPIATTHDLVGVIESVLPRRGKIHPATRTFQALRIAVNDELTALSEGLAGALSVVVSGGRIAVVSFHSLEDRIVKQFFRNLAAEGKGTVINKKVITPSREEQKENPRSRSAKLRIFEKN